MRWDPWNVKNEAELQSYQYFDKLVRRLPRKRNGDFDSAQFGDNDVDAFRHAFVSGIFVHEYSSTVALNAGELIINLKDKRKVDDYSSYKIEPRKSVIVLKQTRTGRNELFFDLATSEAMTRAQFVKAIRGGDYPGYRVAMYYGIATPVSRRDGKASTNLG